MVNRDVNGGYISIKNDFCTHILETSLPPKKNLHELEQLFTETWELLDELLEKRGITRSNEASLAALPPNWSPIPNPRLEWFKQRRPSAPPSEYWHQNFGAFICATQIHLNLLGPNFFALLPKLYSFEYLTPLLYTRSPRFDTKQAHCTRPLVYRDNYPTDYIANAFPENIPATAAQYEEMIAKTPGFIRDYTFIAPRKFGTIEFRTGCSQQTFFEITAIAALKTAGFIAAGMNTSAPRTSREDFFEICKTGKIKPQALKQDLAELEKAVQQLPEQWQAPFNETKKRSETLLARHTI
jgi:hypothetical protein